MAATHSTIDVHGIDVDVVGDRDGIEMNLARLVNPSALMRWAVEGMDTTDLLAVQVILTAEIESRKHTACNPGTGENA